MAEREGIEPSVPLLTVHAISSRAPSAARTSLRVECSGFQPRGPVWTQYKTDLRILQAWRRRFDRFAPETLGSAETGAPGDSVPLFQASVLIAASGADYPELPAKVKAKYVGIETKAIRLQVRSRAKPQRRTGFRC